MPDNQPVHLLHPELQSLLVHWFLACGGRTMPRNADLPLRALETWRPHLAMILPAAYGEFGRFHFHVSGAALERRFGRAMTRKPLREIDARLRATLLPVLEGVCAAGAPALSRAQIARGGAVWCDLVLPLSGHGPSPARLLFASYTTAHPAQREARRVRSIH
jgi:hypothetical protein